MLEKMHVSPASFAKGAWGVLVYNVLVVLWGALVRATGSGAGCGDHWPLCNGAVIPKAAGSQTLVEFAHRITSGIALISVVILMLTAFASFPKRHPVRRAAVASLVFVVLEAIIGAGIVLMRLVAHDDSILRGASMSMHLVNTFLLLGALTYTVWWATREAPARGIHAPQIPQLRILRAAVFMGFGLLMFVGMTGAIAALGDTLFPTAPFGTAGDTGAGTATAHLFLRLRIWHPIAAVCGAVWWAALSHWASLRSDDEPLRRCALLVFVSTLLQLALGVLNVALRAPVWLQLVHLALSNVLVIGCVFFSSELLSKGLVAPSTKARREPRHES